MAMPRGFQEITVQPLGRQSRDDRVGYLQWQPQRRELERTQTELLLQYPRKYVVENDIQIPQCVAWAMNLTALSQKYNLYFVAYGARIHIYRPKGSQQLLDPEPLLILDPPQSSEGHRLSNLVDNVQSFSHNINHLIIGNLGDKEIVLCSCHDGDVVAYYTERLDYSIQFSKFSRLNLKIKPFFHEHVNHSAWGLAIHQKSRLIAVSSNHHEVRVFVFALSAGSRDGIDAGAYPRSSNEEFPEFTWTSPIPRSEATGKILRAHNFWLKLGQMEIADNVPSISFANDHDGEAFSVVASDIRGNIWCLGIWEKKAKRLPMLRSDVSVRMEPQGWGVLVLPPEFFKPARNMFEAFGCPEIVANRTVAFDISPTTSTLSDNIIWHRSPLNADFEADMMLVADHRLNDDGDSDDEESDMVLNGSQDEEDESEESSLQFVSTNSRSGHMNHNARPNISTQTPHSAAHSIPSPFLHNSTSNPLLAHFRSTPASHYLTYQSQLSLLELVGFLPRTQHDEIRSIDHLIPDGSLLFHANRHDVALVPSEPRYPRYTHCERLLEQDVPHDAPFQGYIPDYDRLNMLLTIPELSLVLVASQVGRVALVTVTRVVYDSREIPWGTPTMRVDAILPFASQDSVRGFRPSTGLLGVAVSPMPRREGRGEGRWRVMMQYYDLTVLSYVVSNEGGLRVESL